MRTAEYYGPNGKRRAAVLTVAPAVRTSGRLFVTVDVVPQGDEESVGSDYFCTTGTLCRDMGGLSLVDPAHAVRYGPLRVGSASGAVLSSRPPITYRAQHTYRFGVFFPDPAGSPAAVDLEMLYAGPVLGLPVVDGEVPAEQLGDPAAAPDLSIEPTVLPVAAPGADAFVDRHALALPVVGGTLAEGTAGDRAVVSLAADVLFAFGRADLTPAARSVLAQAAGVLAAQADRTQPVLVVGHTDSKGAPPANLTLSQRRATAVSLALRADPRLRSARVRASGRGETQPAAPNTTPTGTDDPHGRALNRRVEIAYLPRRVVAAPPSSSPSRAGGAAAGPVTVRAAHVVAGGAGATAMTAVVDPLVRRGRLSLVQVHLTQAAPTGGFDYFALARGDRDAGRWSVVVPDTRAVLRPAVDVDDLTRPLTGRVNGMDGGRSYRVDLWTAAAPAGVGSVDVDLGQLGVARAVPVVP